MNQPRKEIFGLPTAASGLNPWQAPPLQMGRQVFEHWVTERAPSDVDRGWCASIAALFDELAPLRNPASHGDYISREWAERAWELLEHLVLSGQAAAMAAIRSGIHEWPRIDWTHCTRFRAEPRPQYEQAVQDYRAAAEELQIVMEKQVSLRQETAPWKAALDALSLVAQSPDPKLDDLVTIPVVTRIGSALEGWTDVKAQATAITDASRQSKALAREAGRLFTTHSPAERHRISDVSRIINPDGAAVRSVADIDGVITRVKAILAAGIVLPTTGHDWQSNVRTRLERWLVAVDVRNKALRHATADAVRQRARSWIAVIETHLHDSMLALANADAHCAEANAVRECADARLRAIRIGKVEVCRCGRHVESTTA